MKKIAQNDLDKFVKENNYYNFESMLIKKNPHKKAII